MTKHQRRPNRRRHLGITLAAGFTIAACSGGNEVADLTTVPAPPATAATPTTEQAVSTTVVETTPASTTPDATDATDAPTSTDTDDDEAGSNGVTGPMFSDALGTKVESAPGVNTRGDTRQLLSEGLYVHIAWDPDPDDPSVFTVQPDDIEILEAYANAVTTYYRAATTTVTTDDPDFARYFVDAGAKYDDSLREALAGNFVGSLGNGVVLRPYVLGDQRSDSTAVVLDCYLQNEQFIPRGTAPQLSELATTGQIATMVLMTDGWKIDVAAGEPRACL